MKSLLICVISLAVHLAIAGATPAVLGDKAWRGKETMAAVNLRRALPSLREGDVIFIGVRHALYRRIADTSGSWESHVGILFRNPGGAWVVAESTVPISRVSPLDRFVSHSENGRFLVRRMRTGLSEAEVARLHAATEHRMGKLYDTGFHYDSSRQFCSKFVYDCFLEATGSPVGKLETFREILAANPGAPVGFWRTWFFGRIPWERRSVTTVSQIRAPNMVTVFDTESGVQIAEAGRHSSPAFAKAAMSAHVAR